jgi:hypothetical protein
MLWINRSENPLSLESSIPSLTQSISLLSLAENHSSTARTIAFVDAHVGDVQTVMANLQSDVKVWLDPTKDGIEQISETLSHYQGLTGIEIISHGNVGEVQLGKNSLSANSLPQYAHELQQWHTSLAPGADILFYGCNVAAGTAGQSFIKDLSTLTGADIAASTNLTGDAQQGGDWELEYTTGKIETKTPFSSTFTNNYHGLLTSVFTTQTPGAPDLSDGVGSAGDYELGMKFSSSKAGQIDAIRYYKSPSETGTHIGRIWSSTGTLLGSVNFTNETASGWQQQSLTAPLNIQANTTYVVSVNANTYFPVTGGGLATTITNGELSTIADGLNGVYNPTPGAFPAASNTSNNYFRDIVFTPNTPPPTNQLGTISINGTSTQNQTLTANVADADGLTGVTINYKWQQSSNGTTWTDIAGATSKTFTLAQAQVNNRVRATATYTDALGTSENPLSTGTAAVVNVNDPGSVSINGITTNGSLLTANILDPDGLTGVTINYKWQQSSNNGTTWTDIAGATNQTFTLGQAQVNNLVRATAIYTDALGGSENVLSPATSAVSGSTILESVFTTQTPGAPDLSDGAGSDGDYELGMEFTSAKAGQINAIRYYKSPSETGTHIGRIWSSTGTLLGSVNFINETASGWQQQSLTAPLNIQANTTYVVSVNANSYFAVTGGGLATTITNGDLSAVADGSNGVYNSTPGAFPSASNFNNNYFRDIVFSPSTPPPTNQPGTISVSGTASQNQILTANVADANGLTGVTINYKWQQSNNNGTTWTDIAGATSQTLTLAQAQVNNLIRSTGTYTDALGIRENPFSSATTAVANVNDLGTIAVSGTTTQNQILTANVADVDGLTGVTINYKWQQSSDNGITWTNISGATAQTIKLGQAQVNNRVRATATYTDALGSAETPLSAATTAIVNVNDVGKVILKGSATVGRSLTETVLDPDGLAGVNIQYRWQQSTNGITWTNITGATSKSFALTNSQLGRQVRVNTTYTDALGTRENSVSAGTTITAQNAIVLENQQAGTTNWQIADTQLAHNHEIEGYGDATSINKGQALNLKVSLAQAGKYSIDVYRLGYYNGNGGRLITSVTNLNGVTQAAPTIDPTTRMVECKWNTSYTLQTAASWTSGLYLAKLTDSTTGKQSYVEFVLRDDGRPAEIGFQDAADTVEAYNNYGGHSTYTFNSTNGQQANKVSFDRPLDPNTNDVLAWEYQGARWLESQGYDVSYYSNTDVHINPLQLYSQNAFLSVGHDEYWSLDMRNNVEQARDNGTNLAFFSANSAYWRVRFESSTTGVANRVMAVYKDDWALDPVAQLDNSQATTRFRSTQVNRPENALMGVMSTGDTNNTAGGFDLVVSNATDPYYANTGLKNGDKIPGLVGYEWDAVVNNGLTPAGLVTLSASPVVPDDVLPGLPAGTNTNISNSVRYTAPSGAKVFSTGSIQWVWGLDSDYAPNPRRSPAAQQIATNVFADLGAQPRTPQIFPASPAAAPVAAFSATPATATGATIASRAAIPQPAKFKRISYVPEK